MQLHTGLPTPSSTQAILAARGLRSAAELGADRPHGTRLRYMSGCRCDLCRKANSSYENERQKARKQGDWNGVVSAAKAQAHLNKLSAAGVGRRAVAAATDIAETVLLEIRSGRKTQIRGRTERKILAVSVAAASDAALTDAAPSWKLIDEMIEGGYTRGRIAHELGRKMPSLQIGKDRMLVRTAHQVEVVHRRLMASDERLLPSKEAGKLLSTLMDEFFTRKQVARHANLSEEELAFGKKVSVRVLNRLKAACAEIDV